jgi:hypothetical protein
VAVVVGFLCDLHIVRVVVEVSEVSWEIEVIVVGTGGQHWSISLTSISWSKELKYERSSGRM